MRSIRKKISKKQIILIATMLCFVCLFLLIQFHFFFVAHQRDVPAKGGIITDSAVGQITNFNPLVQNPTLLDRDIHQLIYAGLLQYNILSGQIEPGLADLVISEDLRTYTLTIKNSAKFSNGDPVTTDDVIFTFEKVIKNPGFQNKALQSAFEYVVIEVIDEKRITFSIPEQNIFFSSLLTTPILHSKSYKDAFLQEIIDPDFTANKKPIGAGPYVLDNFIPNQGGSFRLFLRANKHYYQKPPHIQQYVLYGYPTIDHLQANHTWTTLFSHLSEPFAQRFSREQNMIDRYTEENYVLPRWIGVFYNMKNEYTGRITFRRALQLTTPKDTLLEKEWQKVNSPFFYEGLTEIHEHDPIEARKILRDNGFPYDTEQNVRVFGTAKIPVKIRMITTLQPASYSRMAQNLAKIWEDELNIQVETIILSDIEFQQALQDKTYDVVFFGQNFSYNFDSISLWHSTQANKGLNFSQLENNSIDTLIYQVQISGSRTDIIELNEALSERRPLTILGTPRYSLMYSSELKGFPESLGQIRSQAQRYFDIHTWYFETQKDWNLPPNTSKMSGFFTWLFNGKQSLNKTNAAPVAKPIETETVQVPEPSDS